MATREKKRNEFLGTQQQLILNLARENANALEKVEAIYKSDPAEAEIIRQVIRELRQTEGAYGTGDQPKVTSLVDIAKGKILDKLESKNWADAVPIMDGFVRKHTIAPNEILLVGATEEESKKMGVATDRLITQLQNLEGMLHNIGLATSNFRAVQAWGRAGAQKEAAKLMDACRDLVDDGMILAVAAQGIQTRANQKIAEMSGTALDIIHTSRDITKAAAFIRGYDPSSTVAPPSSSPTTAPGEATGSGTGGATSTASHTKTESGRKRRPRPRGSTDTKSFETEIYDYIAKYQFAADAVKNITDQELKDAVQSKKALSDDQKTKLYSIIAGAWVERAPSKVKDFIKTAGIDVNSIKTPDDMEILSKQLLLAYSKLFDEAKIRAHASFAPHRMGDFLAWTAMDAAEPGHFRDFRATWQNFRNILEDLQLGTESKQTNPPPPPNLAI